MYFVGIRSLFSLILLIYNLVIMLCIDIGYTRHCVGGSFFIFLSSKKVKKRILVVTKGKVKELAKFQQLSSMHFVNISYHYFITLHLQHIKTTYITETVKVRQLQLEYYNKMQRLD